MEATMRQKMTLKRKLLVVGCVLTIGPLIVISLIVYSQNQVILNMAQNENMKMAYTQLDQIVDLIYTNLESYQEINDNNLKNALNVARDILSQKGAVSFAEEKVSWNAVNQFSEAATSLEIPKMQVGSAWFGQITDPKTEVPVVDQVRNLMGTTCTIFQRMNDAGDMLRVATNVAKKDGNRAIGTFIPITNPDGKPNPVLASVLQGQSFVGRAYVVNGWYHAAYEPILDAAKKVIGMLYVGVPQESTKGLRQAIMNIKIGNTGYVYVIDSKGRYIISKDGKRDGEDIFNAKDDDGNLFVQEIIKKALPLKPHEQAEHRYPWKNEGESQARLKIAKIVYFKDWDWVIGAGSYVDEILESSNQMKSLEKRGNTILLVILILSLIGAIFIWLLTANSISKPINRIIQRLTNGAESISSASSQVSATSQSLAQGASEQAASIEESSSSLEEMSSMTKQNAGNAQQADALMKEANTIVAEANHSMEELTKSMLDISKASEETSKIIKTIDEIAFQTNLLALNAAVEAARAGEAGAGFAVVADEVRNLAMRAAEAARNTADLIEGTVKRIKDGSGLVSRTNEAFSQVSKTAAKVGELVAEIAAASGEQAQGIDQISKAVNEMDHVVQQNAAGTEESASASQQMSSQADLLKTIVGELVTLVGADTEKKRTNPQMITSDFADLDESPEARSTAKKIESEGKVAVRKADAPDPEKIIPLQDDF
jgi:methyl-accepting chemotaxis protein